MVEVTNSIPGRYLGPEEASFSPALSWDARKTKQRPVTTAGKPAKCFEAFFNEDIQGQMSSGQLKIWIGREKAPQLECSLGVISIEVST